MPVYYPGDEEVYFKCADMKDGRVFCALFNIGLDMIDQIELVCDFEAKGFEVLMPNGEIAPVPFVKENGKYILEKSAQILDPVVVFIAK